MNLGTEQSPVEHSDYNHISADSAGNAIGSASEFETSSCEVQANDINFDFLCAHQGKQYGAKASDTAKFANGTSKEPDVIRITPIK